MTVNRQRMLGRVLVALGCLWLFLILFHIQPLFLSLFFLAVWLKASNGIAEIVTVVNGIEYLVALATVASGLTFWRRGATGRWPVKMIFAALALFIVGTGTRRTTAQGSDATARRDPGKKTQTKIKRHPWEKARLQRDAIRSQRLARSRRIGKETGL